MNLQEQMISWDNLRLAYQSASKGKRGRSATAEFELFLADNLLELHTELEEKIYWLCEKWHWLSPGQYRPVSAMVAEIGRLLGGWIKSSSVSEP